MKYICIDDGAVAELISGREYQSIDFEAGDKLIKALSGKVQFLANFGKITLLQDEDGAFLTTSGTWKSKRYLVIDCEQSALFTQLRASETLVSFQKLLRFCTKVWTNGIYTKSEKIISGTSKAILFPFPYAVDRKFRIAVERQPWKDRVDKRDLGGQFLLVYKSGSEGADSNSEKASETNFKKAFERLPNVYSSVTSAIRDAKKQKPSSQIDSTVLSDAPSSLRPAHIPFGQWIPLLTAQQQKFVFAKDDVPHQLKGPAGTGKTLSLILRTLRVLKEAELKKETRHALLVTHSEATKDAIQNTLAVVDEFGFSSRDRSIEAISLSVETLASLCGGFLNQSISESEFIDRDAQDSKLLQQMYIEQAIGDARDSDLPSYLPHISSELRRLFEAIDDATMSALVQHEISVLIKGRAGDSFDVYKNCPPLKFGLPVSNEADKGLVYSIFQKYQDQLAQNSQFDTDDVVISAVGQLDTPIWRRRREREGFDFIAVDETHLFNINELHVFHHFTRRVGETPINFTVDEAQAVGDRGWDDSAVLRELAGGQFDESETTEVTAVFRSSPLIRDFCHSVLASGATLFTSFNNTLVGSQSAFTLEDERRSQPIIYFEFPDDERMIETAFRHADELARATESKRPEVLITSLSDEIIEQLVGYSKANNKPVTVLDRRGDYVRIKQAEQSGHMVLGHADFVGGLEFSAAVIVGVDKGRVPFEGEMLDSNSRAYSTYTAHNRLYVAASRAKYGLSIMGVKSRGPSELLNIALDKGIMDKK